ncbi:hypothetical protein [Pseudomonas sp. AOB-7]|uniref:hypothetical protein n=1 Tax=Pseudomonas sp. AOB-7 TaxID=2482750 RepID=UPI0011C43E7F|nr:hypothetical protein [Pseudomonas sp. AOB-7]
MSFAKHGIAVHSMELGKATLALSTLGLFTKLLNIDLSQIEVIGLSMSQHSTELIPGFIGLALIYTFIAFVVARLESSIEQQLDEQTVTHLETIKNSKPLLIISALTMPLALIVYSLPYALGVFSIVLLWPDSTAVLAELWTIASA